MKDGGCLLASTLFLAHCGNPVSGVGGASSSSSNAAISTHATYTHAVASSASTGGAGGAGGGSSSSSQMVMQCGMDQSASVAASSSTTSSGGFQTAAHLPLPGVTQGPTAALSHMELVTITLSGDPNKATEEAFGDFVLTSNWYAAVGAEYGVLAGTQLAKVTLPDTLPASPLGSDIIALLAKHITDGVLPSPSAPNHDVLYLTYLPDVSGVCNGAFFIGCHSSALVATPSGMARVYFAVVDASHYPIDTVTSIASHEIIEAATDPVIGQGYVLRGTADPCDIVTEDAYWMNSFENEVGDLCEVGMDKNVTEGGFTVQRSWSNASAKTGDPCVPVSPGNVYANVSATPSRVQSVPIGSSTVFTLTGWSTAPTADWAISVTPYNTMPFDPNPLLSQLTMNNGGVATLTLSVPPNAKVGDRVKILISSTLPNGKYSTWPVAIEAE